MLLVIADMQNFLFDQIILLSSWNIQISSTFFIIDSWVNEKGYIAALVAVLVICLSYHKGNIFYLWFWFDCQT